MITAAQRAILGAIMLNSRTYVGMCVDKGVQAEWFFGDARKMYEKCVEDFVDGKVTDAITVLKVLPDEAQGLPMGCMEACHTVAHTKHHIDELELEVMEQDALILTDQQRLLASNGIEDVKAFIEDAARSWGDLIISDKRDMTDEQVGEHLLDRWESPDRDKDRITWPLPCLNDAIGNIEQDFVFLAASPSVGKTALALQTCDTLGHPHDPHPMITSMASLESPASMIQPRRIGRVGGINTWKLKNGYGDKGDFAIAREANKFLTQFKTRMHYSGMDLNQIRAWATREKAAGSRLLVIDNMKHVRMKGARGSTAELFMQTSMGLKHIRDDVGLPMIVLHHLNKDGDMAWSSDIERDADIVLFLKENESMSVEGTKANDYQSMDVVDLEVRKNRDGARYITKHLRFVKQHQEFKEMAQW